MPATQEVLAARLIDKGDLFWFASLDGQSWLEVNDDPRLASAEAIQRLFDGNGRTKPMTATRGFLSRYGATFLTGETHA